MKLATLTASVLILSATLISGTASAQTGNLVMMPGAKTCWINGQQIFTCHQEPVVHYKRIDIPPTYPTFRRFGNNGGDAEKGDSNRGDNGNNGGTHN